jgi:hypothetical protein
MNRKASFLFTPSLCNDSDGATNKCIRIRIGVSDRQAQSEGISSRSKRPHHTHSCFILFRILQVIPSLICFTFPRKCCSRISCRLSWACPSHSSHSFQSLQFRKFDSRRADTPRNLVFYWHLLANHVFVDSENVL